LTWSRRYSLNRAISVRYFELLELLQSRPLVTGREIADRLGVDPRTVRRYIAGLEELGVPVEGQRGVGGGYRVRPGFRLPPLMFDEDEAVAVSLGLLRLAGASDSSDRALDKVQRVLPDALRRRVAALESSLAFTSQQALAVDGDTALPLAEAIHRRRRLGLDYVAHTGERTARVVSPYALVVHGSRWYLVAYDHGRKELRTFRADRCSNIVIVDGDFEPPPADLDAVGQVRRSFARIPRRWSVVVDLDVPVDDAATRLPPSLAELSPTKSGARLEMQVDSLDWAATVLAGLGCDFAVRKPKELRAAVRRLGHRLHALA
jgi:predicted DNA-binding transcriptional regulator YafY